MGRHGWRPGLPQLQLRSRLYLTVSARVLMQGLLPAVFSDPRNLARLPEAAGSGPAYGFQSVRQRRQGHQQSSFEPKSGVTYEDRVRLTSQAAMRFDVELHDDHFERGR